ncbi:MAG: ATP-binding protein [Nitrospinaceae bacterium]
MDKQEKKEPEDLFKLKRRIQYLERENQWYYSALEMTSSLGEIHRSLDQTHDPVSIFLETRQLLERMAPFGSISLYLVNPKDSEFVQQTCEPEEDAGLTQRAVDHLIANGTFAWALTQSHALWVEDPQEGSLWFLNTLATRTSVLGMVVGRLEKPGAPVSPEVSKVLSVILQNTAQAIENAQLYQKVQEQNHELEETVGQRTRALDQKAEELELRLQELQDFAYVASHDLREPLRKLLTFSDRLSAQYQAALDDRGRDYLDVMERAVRRMEALIEGLLQLSRVTTEGRPFRKTDLNEVLRRVQANMDQEIQMENGRILADPLPTLSADPAQMHQLFKQLLLNALKFHPPGETPEIRVTARQSEPGCWDIDFQDRGIGIDPAKQARIFKPFETLHGRTQFEGVGMGLPICQKIVRRHKGVLTVHSEAGQGTTFKIRLRETPESTA